MPDITLILKLGLINLLGRCGVGHSESGEVNFSGDSFVNVLIMKSLIFLCLISSHEIQDKSHAGLPYSWIICI